MATVALEDPRGKIADLYESTMRVADNKDATNVLNRTTSASAKGGATESPLIKAQEVKAEALRIKHRDEADKAKNNK